jgi:hypothetical protein
MYSTIKFIKSKYRSVLTDEHLTDLLRTGITSYQLICWKMTSHVELNKIFCSQNQNIVNGILREPREWPAGAALWPHMVCKLMKVISGLRSWFSLLLCPKIPFTYRTVLYPSVSQPGGQRTPGDPHVVPKGIRFICGRSQSSFICRQITSSVFTCLEHCSIVLSDSGSTSEEKHSALYGGHSYRKYRTNMDGAVTWVCLEELAKTGKC